ncbi:hypothetical protein BHM03_00062537, partial [Ensete ventricosum]
SDDAVGSRGKFTRRFAEGIGKLIGNAKGDHRKEDRRTCRKIVKGCRNMQDKLPVSDGWTARTTESGRRAVAFGG